MKRIQLTLVIGLSLLLQKLVHSQDNHESVFLNNVGVLDSIYSEILDEQREFYVQLPVDYNPDKKTKYPVIFVLDGEIFLPTVNEVQNYYSGGYTPEMVIVGISNHKNRMRDLTTSKVTEMYGIPFNQENGGADNFIKFIES